MNERDTLSSAVEALVSALEARDKYTGRHSRLVAHTALLLGNQLSLSAQELEDLRWGSLLHDIGMIGLPDKVLNKKGKLSKKDWEVVKTHPKLGANIVGKVPGLVPCVNGILHHHERWDGTGYPDGLKGEEIPLGARIIGIAESFGAMISERPYRPALFFEEAITEIRQGGGSQFDPKLVDAFLHKFEYKINPELREKQMTALRSLPTHAERIKTALQSLPNWHSIDPGLIGRIGFDLGLASCLLSVEDGPSAVRRSVMYALDRETIEYDQEDLKWLRYRQSRSKTIDGIIKRKDELARSIKEGKVDADHLVDSAAKGDVDSLKTMLPYFEFDYQTRPPSFGEKFTDFLLRR